ncbi:MAG: glycosyltransferase family 39 protein [Cyclobacteriaceae bacterium]
MKALPRISLENKGFYGLLVAIIGLYVAGMGANSIWTTHESYYAEAVREMLESKDWLNITFNYEPRLNKPPLTYWLMAVSAWLFGLQEWSLRLPMVLCSLGTLLLVYRLGTTLYDPQTGRWALLLMAVSLQFAWLKHYASPEIPLTFFFTLTLYGFLQGLLHKKRSYLVAAFSALSLTMLTKGWPYFLIIYAVLAVFLLLHYRFCLPEIKKIVSFRWFFWGNLCALLVGLSWIIAMYFCSPDYLLEVLHFETTQRLARSNQSSFWRQWFFYPEVILWSFFPGSLVLYYAIYRYLRGGITAIQPVALPIAWLGVMMLGFTLSQGKLPSYILQAHPAMALLVAHFIVHPSPKELRNRHSEWMYSMLWELPAGAAILGAVILIVAFSLSQVWYFVIGLLIVFRKVYAHYEWQTPYGAILATLVTLGILFMSLYPSLEYYRPYHTIQQVVKKYPVPQEVPLVVENRFIHNLPFYTQRIELRDRKYTWPDILRLGKETPVLALVDVRYPLPTGYQMLWQGWLYRKGSESHGFQFILHCWKARQGDYQHFHHYQLVFYDPKMPLSK